MYTHAFWKIDLLYTDTYKVGPYQLQVELWGPYK